MVKGKKVLDASGKMLMTTRLPYGQPLPTLSSTPLLRRILASIKRVQSVTGDPVIRTGAARNADTLAAAIRLIEETHP